MKAGIAALGERCSHMLCVWHLAKQMPGTLVVGGRDVGIGGARDLLYNTARGTAVTCEMFGEIMKQDPDSLEELTKTRDKRCRRHSNTLRRDFISTVSGGLNGAVERTAVDTSQIRLAKAFLAHGTRAYQECCEEATMLRDDELMPLTGHCYSVDLDVSKSFTWTRRGNMYEIIYEGQHRCDRGQDKDLGTPCPHILSIEEVGAEDYAHKTWTTNTFKQAFNCRREDAVAGGRVETMSPTSNQMRIIAAVRAAGTISNGATNAMLALLKHKR